MSEELPEPAGAEEPATDPPGDKIYICPACGTRYDEPTTCANGHPATETIEYDRATVEAADGGDAEAVQKIAETSSAAAGPSAGAVQSEAAVAPPEPVPAAEPSAPAAPAAVPAAEPATPAAPPHDVAEIIGAVETAIENAAAAIRTAKSSLGI